MTGTIALFAASGHPWPGGPSVDFTRTDVRAIGKLTSYNNFVVRYLVRLADGRVAFVVVRDQLKAGRGWLGSVARQINRDLRARAIAGTLVVPSRELSFVISWCDVEVG